MVLIFWLLSQRPGFARPGSTWPDSGATGALSLAQLQTGTYDYDSDLCPADCPVALLTTTTDIPLHSDASVRASIYLLDAQGKMIGQSTRWILDGTKADMLPPRPESQRDSILQPGVGPQRGTTPGYMSAIVPTSTEISAKACSGGLRPPSVRGKPNEARRSQTAATTKTTFADISNGVASPRQRNAATPLGLGRIFITIPRVVPRCGPTLG